MGLSTATADLVTVKKHKAQLKFHSGQEKAWDSDARFVFVIAGTQSGKTSFGPWWLYREIQRHGAGDYLAVTATYDLFKLKMLPEMKRVFLELLPGWECRGGDRVIQSTNGDTRIILRSANAPEGLESATAKAAWLDECGQDSFRLESWEATLRRLSLYQGRVLGTTTVYNIGWLKTEVYDRWLRGDDDFEIIQFESIMNPQFPEEEFYRAKRSLPEWKFNMLYRGQFVRPAGMIYEDFDDTIHVADPFIIPASWPRYVGVDFGAVNTALVWIAENPKKEIYIVYRESLEGGKTTRQHAAGALEYAENENVILWAGGAKSEVQQRLDWQDAGIPLYEPNISDVEAGIDRVIELFKTKRLFIFRDCRGILDEIGTYSREIDEYGQPTEKIKDKENFHRLDALRYIIQHIISGSWYIS